MADRITKQVTAKEQVNACLNWLDTMICKGLESGPVAIDLYRPEQQRDDHDNRKFHAIMGDVIAQAVIKIPGQIISLSEYGKEKGKALLVTWFAREKEQMGEPLRKPGYTIIDPLSGEKISVRPSTTQFTKSESGEFCQFLWALGADSGVVFGDPAIREYQSYREASQ